MFFSFLHNRAESLVTMVNILHCDKVVGSNFTHFCSVAARGMSAYRG